MLISLVISTRIANFNFQPHIRAICIVWEKESPTSNPIKLRDETEYKADKRLRGNKHI